MYVTRGAVVVVGTKIMDTVSQTTEWARHNMTNTATNPTAWASRMAFLPHPPPMAACPTVVSPESTDTPVGYRMEAVGYRMVRDMEATAVTVARSFLVPT